ncbi:DNA-directed RNA polymerase subunit alpha C-terminal domain-containing protein [Gemmatimonadota bacterium]
MSEKHSDVLDTEQVLQVAFDDLPLSVRTYNVMRTNGIRTLEEFLQRSRDEILELRGMQKKVWNEIDDLLARYGQGIGRWQ